MEDKDICIISELMDSLGMADYLIGDLFHKKTVLKSKIAGLFNKTLREDILNIEKIEHAKFRLYRDVEDPNWIDIELTIRVETREDFYSNDIMEEVYKVLDDALGKKISSTIMLNFSR